MLPPFSVRRRVITLMTPPMASEPYSVERGPLTISTRSIEFGRDVLDRGAADGAGIDAHAVHQHQHMIGVGAAQEQRSLLPGAAEARYLDAGAHAQQVAEIRGRLAAQFRAADDVDAREHAIRRNFRAGGRDDDGFDWGR